ncbi:MAG: hypothetical protein JW869_04480 [Candidatus Omnitrophica bacterium]|nr:hypothetical protein [Candidatus Omnitrophota bacterium]
MEPLRDPHALKGQLGNALLQKGVITEEQLRHALEVQHKENGLLGEILVQLGYASEEDIVQALAVQHDFPYLPLSNYEIDSEVIKLIPEEIARKYHVLPVDKMGDILTIVIDNLLDSEAVKEIEKLVNCKIEIFVSTNKEIKEAIEYYYSKKDKSN